MVNDKTFIHQIQNQLLEINIVINMSKNRNHIYPTDIHSFCTLGFALGLLVVSKLFDKVHTGFLKKKNTSSHGDCLQMATMILHSNDPHVGV